MRSAHYLISKQYQNKFYEKGLITLIIRPFFMAIWPYIHLYAMLITNNALID